MKTDRRLLPYVLLSIITLGIYSLFFWHAYAKDVNVVCEEDGKFTRGIFGRVIFSILTLGIYNYVWMYSTAERISRYCHKRDIYCATTGSNVLLWNLLGSFVLVGPFIADYKLFSGLNDICTDYLNTHPEAASA